MDTAYLVGIQTHAGNLQHVRGEGIGRHVDVCEARRLQLCSWHVIDRRAQGTAYLFGILTC
jgi:hypothetical protein